MITRSQTSPIGRTASWAGISCVAWAYLWSEHRLIVELDGFGPHSTRQAFRADRRRDRKLRLEGWRVLRFTYADVTQDPHGVVAELRVHTS